VPSQDLARRAVVTGLGAVTPIGNDHPTFWRNLVAGVSGAGPITSFDPAAYDVRIAAEVKDFDPTIAMDRKMARRMSRFIHLAMAAGKEAIADSGSIQRWSRSVGTGRRLRQHRRRGSTGHRRRRGGPREGTQLREPLRHPRRFGIDGSLPDLDGLRPDRSRHHPGGRLCEFGHRLP
jgi:3-oxoacyl-(acyl-carrier-protein) synthase